MRSTAVKARRTDSVFDELDRMQHQIAQRAYDLFNKRGSLGAALDDWLAAEKESVWKPAVEVCQNDSGFVIEAAIAGVEPEEIEIQVTPDSVLITSNITHSHPEAKGKVHVCEFETGKLFRIIELPSKIDPDSVKAEYHNGLLRLTAAIAAPVQARKVEIQAA